MGLSATAANEWLDKEFGNDDYTPPANHDVCLYSVMPNASGVGGTELSGGGYAPVTVANNGTSWSAAANKRKTNATAISFPTASADWQTAVGVVIKVSGGGAVRAMGLLDPTVTVRNGQRRTFAAGDLVVQAI